MKVTGADLFFASPDAELRDQRAQRIKKMLSILFSSFPLLVSNLAII